jgi:hypothetical protein
MEVNTPFDVLGRSSAIDIVRGVVRVSCHLSHWSSVPFFTPHARVRLVSDNRAVETNTRRVYLNTYCPKE